jgi:hypothetical protein
MESKAIIASEQIGKNTEGFKIIRSLHIKLRPAAKDRGITKTIERKPRFAKSRQNGKPE